MTNRRIIHLDLDAFYCAVEEQRNPNLHGKPFAVGGRPEQRGVVSSCSYAARAVGVRSAMPMAQALRLCPQLIVVPGHYPAYRQASRQVMMRLRALTDLVEPISIDEAFLDVSALDEPVQQLARQLQDQIRTELGLPCSLGIASNKLVAKIATDVGKKSAGGSGPPNAITQVPAGQEAAFLAPLPVEMLWGVGPKTAGKLASLGIETIGDLAVYPEGELVQRYGKVGYDLARRAGGIDHRPVVTEHAAKSISQEVTFAKDLRDVGRLQITIHSQAQHVAHQLQRQGLVAHTIKLKLRWPDFTTLTRQVTLENATADADLIAGQAAALFEKEWQAVGQRPLGQQAVRLIGVGVSGLERTNLQLNLFDPGVQKAQRLHEALAALRQRFGEQVIFQGPPDRESEVS
ncbi:MAG: DNA polymerase IV [Anaerolineales bacterium]|nr:DNA polymerase IV [Anaerolineales bacterium]